MLQPFVWMPKVEASDRFGLDAEFYSKLIYLFSLSLLVFVFCSIFNQPEIIRISCVLYNKYRGIQCRMSTIDFLNSETPSTSTV